MRVVVRRRVLSFLTSWSSKRGHHLYLWRMVRNRRVRNCRTAMQYRRQAVSFLSPLHPTLCVTVPSRPVEDTGAVMSSSIVSALGASFVSVRVGSGTSAVVTASTISSPSPSSSPLPSRSTSPSPSTYAPGLSPCDEAARTGVHSDGARPGGAPRRPGGVKRRSGSATAGYGDVAGDAQWGTADAGDTAAASCARGGLEKVTSSSDAMSPRDESDALVAAASAVATTAAGGDGDSADVGVGGGGGGGGGFAVLRADLSTLRVSTDSLRMAVVSGPPAGSPLSRSLVLSSSSPRPLITPPPEAAAAAPATTPHASQLQSQPQSQQYPRSSYDGTDVVLLVKPRAPHWCSEHDLLRRGTTSVAARGGDVAASVGGHKASVSLMGTASWEREPSGRSAFESHAFNAQSAGASSGTCGTNGVSVMGNQKSAPTAAAVVASSVGAAAASSVAGKGKRDDGVGAGHRDADGNWRETGVPASTRCLPFRRLWQRRRVVPAVP